MGRNGGPVETIFHSVLFRCDWLARNRSLGVAELDCGPAAHLPSVVAWRGVAVLEWPAGHQGAEAGEHSQDAGGHEARVSTATQSAVAAVRLAAVVVAAPRRLCNTTATHCQNYVVTRRKK